jgi:PKD repeat protein/sugar lactone lactonase YvrE
VKLHALRHLILVFISLVLAACGGGGGGGSSGSGGATAPSVSISGVSPTTPVAAQMVAFTATGSGTGLSYAWNFADGSATGTGASVNHAFASPGSFDVVVTATDTGGATATATAHVVVSATPVAASISSFTPATPLAGQAVTLVGTGGGQGALSYSWNYGDGSAAGTGASSTHTYAAAGSYTVVLTVTDSLGHHTSASNGLTVVMAPTAQISSISQASPDVGQTVSFSGTGTGQGALSYAWDFGDGTHASGSTVSHAYTALGSNTVTLTVSDAFGHATPATSTVSVASLAPTAHITPVTSGTAGQSLTFSGSGSGQGSLSYAWNFGDGSAAGSGASTSHSYAHGGSYTVILTVTDAVGGTATASNSIAIVNPAVFGSITGINPVNAVTAQAVSFASSASGGIGAFSYAWNFGDGQSGTGASPSHTYSAHGSYSATLVVSDSLGTASSQATYNVTVNDPPAPSALTIVPGQLTPAINVAVGFTGTASGSNPLSYAWDFGDGSAAGSGLSTTHTYVKAGTYTVTMTVTDPFGQHAQATATLTAAPGMGLLAGVLGGAGNVDGTGVGAAFDGPAAVAVDASGNRYVADTQNSTIRMITPAGVVTTLAGMAGQAGSNDGQGAAARFSNPAGIAVDSSGTIYVADTGNNTIRLITPARLVSTLAGQAGVDGSNDGSGSGAHFSGPLGVAVDGSGLVYVADTGNNTIRTITALGVVNTLAGDVGSAPGYSDDTGTAAQFDTPSGLVVDGSGNVYVADTGNSVIRMIGAGAVVTTFAGTAGSTGSMDGSSGVALFNTPVSIARDSSGNLYVADQLNENIRKLSAAGTVSTLAGNAGSVGFADGSGAAARFGDPSGIAVDSTGTVYVADMSNDSIRQITPAGAVTTLAGSASVLGFTNGTGAAARFNSPYGVAADSAGNVYVADGNAIRKITPAGKVTTFAGAAAAGAVDNTGTAARFNSPYDVAVDKDGNVYVADAGNNTIRKITPAGVVTTLAGTAGVTGSADGSGAAAQFNGPSSIAVDGNGIVYVADEVNSTIRKITPSGDVSTLAGMAGSPGSSDGNGSAARFANPSGVAVDGNGTVYVADAFNDTIRKITPAGAVSTVAGVAGQAGSVDGTGSAARFNDPWSVVVDSSGNLYVADTGNSTLRKITPGGVVTTVVGVAGQIGYQLNAPVTLASPSDLALLPNGNLVLISGLGAILETSGL